jgi:hypothetical protein
MRWIVWLLMGIALALAMALGACLIALARLNPWLARRLAGSSLAAAALLFFWEIAMLRLDSRRD